MPKRDEFSEKTKQLLARRAGFRYSICQCPTVGPHSEPGQSVYLGEACHICEAALNGPRPKQSLAPAERTAASNGIHLCKVHARLIDVHTAAYTAERLMEIKSSQEQRISTMVVGSGATSATYSYLVNSPLLAQIALCEAAK